MYYQLKADDVDKYLCDLCAGLDLDHVHWVHGDDEAQDWCHSCCTFKVRHLRRRNKKNRDDYSVDGGYGSESDGVAVCAGCGELLAYSLSDSGVREELWHFLIYGFADEGEPIAPQTAYEMLRIFRGAKYMEDVAEDINRLADQIRQRMRA